MISKRNDKMKLLCYLVKQTDEEVEKKHNSL